MKYACLFIILIPALISCNSRAKTGDNADTLKGDAVVATSSGPFDLARLELKENIPAIIKQQQIKLEAVSDTDKTLFGYERVKSYDAKALKYGPAVLTGSDGMHKNYVLLHFDGKTNKLAFFQVIIYNLAEADALQAELLKMGEPTFKKKWPDGSVELDENGNAVAPKANEKQLFQVWDNKRTGISYFYSAKENSKSFRAELTVLKMNDQSGKDWMNTSGLNFYQNTKSD